MAAHLVILGPGAVLKCLECGWSYRWRVPVPIPMFVAGNLAMEREHEDCPIYRLDWRRRLLRVLDERFGALEAQQMEADWDEAVRRGEI